MWRYKRSSCDKFWGLLETVTLRPFPCNQLLTPNVELYTINSHSLPMTLFSRRSVLSDYDTMAASSAAGAPLAPATASGPRRVCAVCCQQVAHYTCPRCHKAYCSSTCYKQHSHQCTEAFYREQATSQMKATRADASQTQDMMRILQRLHEQQQQDDGDGSTIGSEHDGSSSSSEDDDDASGPDLSRTPALRQLIQWAAEQGDNFDIHPNQLTPEVLQELDQLAVQGQLSHLLTPWQPWWTLPAAAELQLNEAGQRVVQDLSSAPEPSSQPAVTGYLSHDSCRSTSASTDAAERLPAPPAEPLPSLHALAGPGFKPSPLLPWQLLQLLVAYCAVLRLYNGEPDTNSRGGSSSGQLQQQGWDAAEQLVLLAPPLTQLAAPAVSQLAEQQQVGQVTGAPPDSARSACMQLLAAAASQSAARSFSVDEGQQERGGSNICSTAAEGISSAVSEELRALLQVATADALMLLQLGRSVVVLALTDSWRMMEQGRQNLKQQQKQEQQKQKQQKQVSAPAHCAAASKSSIGAKSSRAGVLSCTAAGKQSVKNSSSKKSRQQWKQLEQHFKLAARKLHFYMAWANEQPREMYEHVAFQLSMELQEQQDISRPAASVSLHQQGAGQAVAHTLPVLPHGMHAMAAAKQEGILHRQEGLKEGKQQHMHAVKTAQLAVQQDMAPSQQQLPDLDPSQEEPTQQANGTGSCGSLQVPSQASSGLYELD